jgi:hypothetical protein
MRRALARRMRSSPAQCRWAVLLFVSVVLTAASCSPGTKVMGHGAKAAGGSIRVTGSAVDELARAAGTTRRTIVLSEEQVAAAAQRAETTTDDMRNAAEQLDATDSSLATKVTTTSESLSLASRAQSEQIRGIIRDACWIYSAWLATESLENLRDFVVVELGGAPVRYVSAVIEVSEALADADGEGKLGVISRVVLCGLVEG